MRMVGGALRPPPARWVVVALSAGLAAIFLAMMIGGAGTLDRLVFAAFYAGGQPGWIAVARALSLLGDPRVLIPGTLAIAAWLWWRGHRHSALTLVAVTLAGRGLNSLIKLGVARARPDIEPHLMVELSKSFPSGHAAGSMIFFLTLALLLAHRRRWRGWAAAAAILVAILVGLSRVMLGVHWPSDVVGGWTFGALWVLVTLRMAEDLVAPRLRR